MIIWTGAVKLGLLAMTAKAAAAAGYAYGIKTKRRKGYHHSHGYQPTHGYHMPIEVFHMPGQSMYSLSTFS